MDRTAIYVVATPIGNLDDLSLRAQKVLSNVDLIAAEDTRRAKQLLNHIGVSKKEITSYFDHVENTKAPLIIERIIAENLCLALISDAGTPCISDPGYRLIAAAHERGVKVIPIPGPSALAALVSCSGLPNDRFTFIGFLPHKDKALEDEIHSWLGNRGAIIFYESTRRLKKSLAMISRQHREAKVAIGREMTKLHEELLMMPIGDAIDWCDEHQNLKGEVAVMIASLSQPEEGASINNDDLEALLKEELQNGARFKDLLGRYKACGLARADLYNLLVKVKESL